MNKQIKIGFSKIGGIYVGELENSKLHKHRAITIALSFNDKFEFEGENQKITTSGLISQPNTNRKYNYNPNTLIAFVHIEPFFSLGSTLLNKDKEFEELVTEQTKEIAEILMQWCNTNDNSEKLTETVIENIIKQIATETPQRFIDERIKKSIDLIWNSEQIDLSELASINNISIYRFSHLFKQETGISFKEYVLHKKLIKSLQAIVTDKETLTTSAYMGGFSDQPHFNRTYLNAFGVPPGKSIK
ncbi:helix-turn-helix domain-containing protein [Avrilella dinanensis]|uniref:HTH araC/xylS-type domain-containing protein n=1 Tax=Avrilella dinanensis TaxID=2008672 RepID=A0A2M9R5B0_9FLAO|nr:AraC family transcriptional regulator [Avrilella dinanensis]PJR04040.1 hypothetical protein CDL10_05500 [Avrilella dinanensis]